MENEALISTSQINDEFTLMSLFFRADLVVKLVILILFAASIFSWTIIIHKIRLFRSLKKISKQFEEEFWSGRSIKEIASTTHHLSESPIKYVFLEAVDEIEKSNKDTKKNIIINLHVEQYLILLGALQNQVHFLYNYKARILKKDLYTLNVEFVK